MKQKPFAALNHFTVPVAMVTTIITMITMIGIISIRATRSYPDIS